MSATRVLLQVLDRLKKQRKKLLIEGNSWTELAEVTKDIMEIEKLLIKLHKMQK